MKELLLIVGGMLLTFAIGYAIGFAHGMRTEGKEEAST